MRVIRGGHKTVEDPEEARRRAMRRGLLAKIHIAKKDLRLTNDQYEAILGRFKVVSAGDLPVRELEKLVKFFRSLGWKPRAHWERNVDERQRAQVLALRHRIRDEAVLIRNWQKRLDGLVKKVCRVDVLDWCWDVPRLERLLKIIREIGQKDSLPPSRPAPRR